MEPHYNEKSNFDKVSSIKTQITEQLSQYHIHNISAEEWQEDFPVQAKPTIIISPCSSVHLSQYYKQINIIKFPMPLTLIDMRISSHVPGHNYLSFHKASSALCCL